MTDRTVEPKCPLERMVLALRMECLVAAATRLRRRGRCDPVGESALYPERQAEPPCPADIEERDMDFANC